ncbi:DNL zinc finger-domain-containing protein [Multifurca ochricompacta]|uniref:DNL zinc finger-domain-containing protein n=1 Tax=Multifurca ochricompacta TaxID=376703 RepID=A0AAD4QRE5_9AGAM|nr:DNL zinc finger-domain-containing protein [Multifurca ochricompacta]
MLPLSLRLLRSFNSATRPRILWSQYSPRSRQTLAVRHNSGGVSPTSVSGLAPSTVTSDPQATQSDANEPRLSLTFTCTAASCDTRSTHQFTKRAYERGIVLIECPGCRTRHLIADNLGWFKESTEDGKLRNVEDLLRARGESVRRGRLNPDGSIEVNE